MEQLAPLYTHESGSLCAPPSRTHTQLIQNEWRSSSSPPSSMSVRLVDSKKVKKKKKHFISSRLRPSNWRNRSVSFNCFHVQFCVELTYFRIVSAANGQSGIRQWARDAFVIRVRPIAGQQSPFAWKWAWPLQNGTGHDERAPVFNWFDSLLLHIRMIYVNIHIWLVPIAFSLHSVIAL